MKKILFSLLCALTISFNIQAQTEPVNQPTNLEFLGVKAYGMSLNFTPSDAGRYIVLRNTSAISDVPVDGNSYLKGERIGSSKVFFVGPFNNTSIITIRESVANTDYHFAVFGFNDGASPNYKTDNPLIGNDTTLGREIGNYYANYRIDTEDAIDDLTSLLFNHTHLSYGDYYDKLVKNIYERDTTNGKKYVVCDYSNNVYVYDNNDYNNSTFNREHVTPKSWMPTTPVNSAFEASDYINLFPVKASVNTKRSNRPTGEVVNQTWSDMDSKYGTDQNNDLVFEPKESIKGNLARANFYEIVTYDGKSGSWAFNNLLSYGNQQDVAQLVQWHQQDPPDNFEIARNEYLYKIQGNRNPFIDFPEWVNCIDFKTLTLNGNCPLDTATKDTTGIFNVYNDRNVSLYPNPMKSKGFLKLRNNEKIQKIELIGLNGEQIDVKSQIHHHIADIDVANISNGIYLLRIYTKERNYYKKLKIIH